MKSNIPINILKLHSVVYMGTIASYFNVDKANNISDIKQHDS